MAGIENSAYSKDGTAVDYDESPTQPDPETHDDAEKKGPSEVWQHWEQEITAAYKAEERWREEAREAEISYFGDDDHAYTKDDYKKKQNQTNIIHANIEILKPLVFSERPDPIVRRRFGGDGEANDPTERLGALAIQRLADYMIDTSGFMEAMEQVRDDWLVAGRGLPRVLYKAEFEKVPVINPMTGEEVMRDDGTPIMRDQKKKEDVCVKHWPWPRVLFSASNNWADVRWVGFETPMTYKKVEARFGQEIAEAMTYPINGLKKFTEGNRGEMLGWEPDHSEDTSKMPSVSASDQCIVYEIWDRESGNKVIWWSPHYREDICDQVEDPLKIDDFFNFPKPLLAATKNGMLTPRPDVALYQARADEIDLATKKLNRILKAISVSGAYPGKESAEMKTLLNGQDKLVAIEDWVGFLEKGGMGAGGIIQWLPLEPFIKAAQALIQMREQAKQALYEISGISDIVRGQSDPDETLGAQQIKGSYANLRLRDKQSKIQHCARSVIDIMIDVGLEFFDLQTIIDIVNMDLPMTEADLQAMNAQADQARQQHAIMVQAAQAAKQPPPPEPEIPFYEQTSWERVHETMKDDRRRRFTLSIETDGTILADLEEDKKQRVEFLQAFNGMVESLFPMAQSGVIEMKVIKELLLFAVRGFPKSRTLEGMLASLPDKLDNAGPQEPPQVTVAKIRAETEKILKEMDIKSGQQEQQSEQAHEMRMAGAEMIADGFMKKLEGAQRQARPQ